MPLQDMIGYCVRCKSKRQMVDATKSKTKLGQPMMKGKCPTCSTKMNRFVKK